MSGPLSGIRIVDLTTMISGPLATQMLADQGANVVKVESPDGDTMRHYGVGTESITPQFLTANRNKRSVKLDLKTEVGRGLLVDLIKTADVVVENFRPGTAGRMGIGESEIRAVKPDIVYVSITGFGDTGPYIHKRVYDPIIQATSGVAAVQADQATGKPKFVRIIIADQIAAMTAAQAITAALFARTQSGEGQSIKLAMLDAMVSFMLVSAFGQLVIAPKDGGRRPLGRADKIYETTDGHITMAVASPSEWRGLCTALVKPEWLNDERFSSSTARVANEELFIAEVQKVFRLGNSEQWLKALDENDVPCAPVLGMEDLLNDPQICANEMVGQYNHPEWGQIRQARPAAIFNSTPSIIRSHAPSLGQHTLEVLTEIGVSSEVIEVAMRRS